MKELSEKMNSDFTADYIFAGVLTTALGVVGMLINITVILALIRAPLFYNAFGYLCILHLISNAGELLVFAFWGGPATIWQLGASITDTFFGSRIGQAYFFFWFCALYSDLLIAANRLVAIEWPLMYNKTFAGRRLIYFIAGACIISLGHALVFSTYDCALWFDSTLFSWSVRSTTCGYIAIIYMVVAYEECVCVVIFITDTITFCCIWKRAKSLRYSNGTNSEHERRMLKMNISFYVQGCIQNVVLIFANLSYLVLSNFASTRFEVFLTCTLNWILAYMSYSIILVVFNQPLRATLWKPTHFLKKSNTTITPRSPTSHALSQVTH